MPTEASTNIYDEGLTHLKDNVTHFVVLNSAPTDFSDADTLVGSGGSKLAERTLTGSELTLQDDGTQGREIIVPKKGYLADESGDVTHVALIDRSGSEKLIHYEHDDGNGNPVSITATEGYNVEQTSLTISGFSST